MDVAQVLCYWPSRFILSALADSSDFPRTSPSPAIQTFEWRPQELVRHPTCEASAQSQQGADAPDNPPPASSLTGLWSCLLCFHFAPGKGGNRSSGTGRCMSITSPATIVWRGVETGRAGPLWVKAPNPRAALRKARAAGKRRLSSVQHPSKRSCKHDVFSLFCIGASLIFQHVPSHLTTGPARLHTYWMGMYADTHPCFINSRDESSSPGVISADKLQSKVSWNGWSVLGSEPRLALRAAGQAPRCRS